MIDIKEQISAFVDSELDSNEVDALCDELIVNGELQAQWEHYHLISSAIRHEISDNVLNDLPQRVSAALMDEPTVLAPKHYLPSVHSMTRHIASFAIAASITAVAILGIQKFTTPVVPEAIHVAATPQESEWVRVSGTRWDMNKPAVESQLNAYLVKHNEYATGASTSGMLPYVNIVSYDTKVKPVPNKK